jgi:hypothetical protein
MEGDPGSLRTSSRAYGVTRRVICLNNLGYPEGRLVLFRKPELAFHPEPQEDHMVDRIKSDKHCRGVPEDCDLPDLPGELEGACLQDEG